MNCKSNAEEEKELVGEIPGAAVKGNPRTERQTSCHLREKEEAGRARTTRSLICRNFQRPNSKKHFVVNLGLQPRGVGGTKKDPTVSHQADQALTYYFGFDEFHPTLSASSP